MTTATITEAPPENTQIEKILSELKIVPGGSDTYNRILRELRDPAGTLELGYRLALCRRAEPHEIQICLDYMREHDSPFEGLAWMLFNLDEFVYVR